MNSWAAKYAEELTGEISNVLFAACSGATTIDVTSNGQYPTSPSGVFGARPQVEELAKWNHDASADIVFVSIGGNDARFQPLITDCLFGSCDPADYIKQATDRGIGRDIRSALLRIKAAAPGAEIYLADYPNPVLPARPTCGQSRFLKPWEQERVQVFMDGLRVIQDQAASEAGVWRISLSSAFRDKGLCTGSDLVNGWTLDNDLLVDSFHPTQMGHQTMEALVKGQIDSELGRRGARVGTYTGSDAVVGADKLPQVVISQFTPVVDGQRLHIQFDGPRNTVILLPSFSVPVLRASGATDNNGHAEFDVWLPKDYPPGPHVIQVVDANTAKVLGVAGFVVPLLSDCPGAVTEDFDSDGLDDSCDSLPYDGPTGDFDSDSVVNVEDNCPSLANSDQLDSDGDHYGDRCDPDDPARFIEASSVTGPSAAGIAPTLITEPFSAEANVAGGYAGPLAGVTVSDSDDSTETLTLFSDAPTTIPLGITEVRWTVKDPGGHARTATQMVSVVDTTAPTISCPPDTYFDLSGQAGIGVPTVTDRTDPHPTVTNDAPIVWPTGTNPVMWTARDASGNTSTCTQKVTVTSGSPNGAAVLKISGKADRSDANPLSGAILTRAGNGYVFLDGPGKYTKVEFWLDNPGRTGNPRQRELHAPWDFAGGSVSTASPVKLSTLSAGTHTITAVAYLPDGVSVVTNGQFTVTSPDPPPPSSANGRLRVATNADRANPTDLDGWKVGSVRKAFIFLDSAEHYTKVEFWLDNPSLSGEPRQRELLSPWDFGGGNTRTANGFNVGALPKGTHTVTAVATRSNGQIVTYRAKFST